MSSQAKDVSLKISAIVHATEDLQKVIHAIRNICQLSGSAEPAVNRTRGHHGNQITTILMTVKNPKAAENCLRDIWNRLTILDKDTIFSSLASRVDISGTLFLRIDKQWAFRGAIRVQDSDPIKVGISFKPSWPKQDGVANDIQKFLTEISGNAARTQ